MGIYDDREDFRTAMDYSDYGKGIELIAKEIDRLAGFSPGKGSIYQRQVAIVLYAARSIGYKIIPASKGLESLDDGA